MAKFDILIPFILFSETKMGKETLSLPLDKMFEQAKNKGYANVPGDTGGPTMCGVTLATYRAYRRKRGYSMTTIADLQDIPFITWKNILKAMFWDRWQGDKIKDQSIANALVDWTWVSGRYGITIPQSVLEVVADGIVGPKTLRAINTHPNPKELFNKIQIARKAYHERIVKANPAKSKFLRGWQKRVNRITYEGFVFD